MRRLEPKRAHAAATPPGNWLRSYGCCAAARASARPVAAVRSSPRPAPRSRRTIPFTGPFRYVAIPGRADAPGCGPGVAPVM